MLPVILTAAIVVDNQTPLQAAPDRAAPSSATLWRGDWLEVRGEAHGLLAVYDHRRLRAGYVARERVRTYPLDEAGARSLWPVIEFVRDTRGAEALGIGLVALYLRAAPAREVDAAAFAVLGDFAEALGRRASERGARSDAEAMALDQALEVAGSYGVQFARVETHCGVQICYDGDAFRRLLALGGTDEARARAVLALADPRCADPRRSPSERSALDAWRADVLDRADPLRVAPELGNLVRLRRAEAWASVAGEAARRADADAAKSAFERAFAEMAGVDRALLSPAERNRLEEITVRIAAERWAKDAAASLPSGLQIVAGRPGETCFAAGEWRQCTYGHVWRSSVQVAPKGRQLAVSVEPLPGWVELWILTRAGGEWRVDTLVPAATAPELGYVELAGWTPDGARLLVTREVKVNGALRREFQLLSAADLTVVASARRADALPAFRRFPSAAWRRETFALR